MVAPITQLRRLKVHIDVLRALRPGVECPVCGNRLWFWKIPRNEGTCEAQCQRCLSLPRQRRTALFLRRQTNLYRYAGGAPLRVLHVAPDPRLQAELEMLPGVESVTGDLTPVGVDVVLDLTAIDFPDGWFDAILCSHVMEHIPADQQAMSEIRRVLAPGGWALLDVPSDPHRTASYEDPSITTAAQRLANFGQDDHVRIYAHGDIVKRLEAAGFQVVVDPLSVTPAERRRYLLDEPEDRWERAYLCQVSGSAL